MRETELYAVPRTVTALEECFFYHTMEVPGFGIVEGQWDLRGGVEDYLGRVDFRGKRVLDVGAANGFLSFQMEARGAEVVGYDLDEHSSWDVVPFSRHDHPQSEADRRQHLRQLNNAYWLCHRALASRARMVYGSVYDIPDALGEFDVTVLGSVLLHVRDPFRALHSALRHTRETAIVTEPLWGARSRLLWRLAGASMRFLPDHRKGAPVETWWVLPPALVQRFLGVLGFERTVTRYHRQPFRGSDRLLYTIVAHRTQEARRAG